MPEDESDLAYLLANLPRDIPVTVIGLGSNLIVRDGGVAGVVIRLGRGFNETTIEAGQSRARRRRGAGSARREGRAGSRDRRARVPARHSGRDRRRVAHERRRLRTRDEGCADRSARRRSRRQHPYLYECRRWASPIGIAACADDVIFTQALFEGAPGDPAAIAAEMDEITGKRETTQPVKSRTGGSTFKNPPGHKAWQLIDAAGCRGLIVGGAQVSELHCNFLINLGNATAADIESLGEEVRRRVKDNSGVTLEWEIKRIGV